MPRGSGGGWHRSKPVHYARHVTELHFLLVTFNGPCYKTDPLRP